MPLGACDLLRAVAHADDSATNRCMKVRDSAFVCGPGPRQSGSRSRGSEADGSRALSAGGGETEARLPLNDKIHGRRGCRARRSSGEPAPRPTTVPVR